MANPKADNATGPVDGHISRTSALTYWQSQPADNDSMLGGYAHISRIDLQGSANFLAKQRRQQQRRRRRRREGETKPPVQPLARAVDCGAGIGRVTTGLLLHVAAVVDVVEPVAKFTDAMARRGGGGGGVGGVGGGGSGIVGEISNVGLEDWAPRRCYNLIWNQWCLGQLTDAQLVAYLRRSGAALAAGGLVVVKENMSTDPAGRDIFDGTDSSVTRALGKWKTCFAQAGLRVVGEEVQRGFPADLYPVRMFALVPDGLDEP